MRKILAVVGVVLLLIAIGKLSTNPSVPAAQATVTAAPHATPDQLAKAAKCEKALKSDRSGMWRRYEWRGSILTVETGATYTLADYETKAALNGLMRCVATQGRMDESIDYADYLDWRTHQTVAEWSPALGLQVK
jgi:hypothetical protein